MLLVYNCSFKPSFLLYVFLSKRLNPHKKKQVLQGSALKPENSPQSFHCLKQMLSPCVAMVLKSVDEALVLLHPLVLNSAGMETIRLGGMVVGVEFFWFHWIDQLICIEWWYFRKSCGWCKLVERVARSGEVSIRLVHVFMVCFFLRRLDWIHIPKTWHQYPNLPSNLLPQYSLWIPRAILPLKIGQHPGLMGQGC